VKRTLIAGVFALVAHGFLLEADLSWLNRLTPPRPKHREVTITLSYFHPEKPKPKPAAQKPAPVIKKAPNIVRPEIKKPKPKPKPKPKIIKKRVKPKKKIVKKPVTIEKKRSREPKPPIVPPKPERNEVQVQKETPQKILEQPKQDAEPARTVSLKKEASSPHEVRMVKEVMPLYRKNPPPEYPIMARRKRYQGTVLLEILVTRDGMVSEVKIHRSSGYPVLDRSALAAVKKWSFEPARRGDEPVDMWVRVPVKFRLN
jgi:protein TonB